MELNVQDASKFAKVARSTVYEKIKSGELSKNANNLLDVAELLRVFGSPTDRDRLHKKTQLENIEQTQKTPPEVEFLREQVRSLREQLDESKKREAWLMAKLDSATDFMKLLEAPKDDKQEKGGFFARLIR